MLITLPNLQIDQDGTGPDAEVMLTQDFGGNNHMVTLHPSQVRLLAERMGLTAAPDDEARRIIARLSRQLRLLHDRIDELDDMMLDISARGHENVEVECEFSSASLALAREFVAELPPANDPKFPVQRPQISGGTPPETGSLPAAAPKEINGLPGDSAAGQLMDNRGSAAPLQPLHPTPAMAAPVAKVSPANGTSHNPAQPELL